MAMDFFTQEAVKQLIPKVKNFDEWYSNLVEILPQYDIDTSARVAAFMAQCGHESGGFTTLQENLNYSAKGLVGTFKKYFPTEAQAKQYERRPEMIANRVYANRMGNGDEASGEGWYFRGRGIVQITGKNNYTKCSQALFEDNTLVDDPDLLLEAEYAIHSACWFWSAARLNELADIGDIKTMTKRINGGYLGLEERINHYNHAIEILT
jgi:putative chitinase